MNKAPLTSSTLVRTTFIIAMPVLILACLCSPFQLPSLAAAHDPSVVAQLLEPAGFVATAPLIISDFRLRGPNGPNDEFVEIYNNSDSNHTVSSVDGSSGYALVGSSNATLNDGLVATRSGGFCSFGSTQRMRMSPNRWEVTEDKSQVVAQKFLHFLDYWISASALDALEVAILHQRHGRALRARNVVAIGNRVLDLTISVFVITNSLSPWRAVLTTGSAPQGWKIF